jgi:hypothetical protein
MAFDEDMLGIFHGDSHFMGISPRNLGAFPVKKWDVSKDLSLKLENMMLRMTP